MAGGDLFLPLGREVNFQLTSSDYIYILAIPELDLEGIAVPEMTHKLSFHTRHAVDLELLPDPMCGIRLSHDERMGSLVVGDDKSLASWLRKQQ